jgi:RND superfamily putative drug exporter
MDLLSTRLPAANGASGRMVLAAPEGQTLTTPKARAAIAATLKAATADGARITQITDPFTTAAVSKDGRFAYSQVTFGVEKADLAEADRTHLTDAEAPARAAGLQVAVAGDAAAHPAAGGATEGIGVAVALVVLAIAFGSIVAAGLPLLIALLSVGLGITSILLLSAFTNLTSLVITLIPALMSLLGARAWWLPSRMRRIVPNVDIEGAGLQPQETMVACATA